MRKNGIIRWIMLGLFAFLFASTFLQISFAAHPKPLAGNKAFVFSYTVKSTDTILLNWKIAPGYYLYREHLNVKTVPETAVAVKYPKGIMKFNKEKRQRVEIYKNRLHFAIKLKDKPQQVIVQYQGCSSRGFCYPPMHQNIMLTAAAAPKQADNPTAVSTTIPAFSLRGLLTNQNGVNAMLATQQFGVIMLLFVALGLLLAFTPCVLPMIPILTSIIVGQGQSVNTLKAFLLSSTYVLGTAVTYALAGLGAAYMGNSLQVWLQKPIIIAMVAALFVLLALSLFGWYEIRLPSRWQNRITNLSNQQQSGTYIGVFLMGVLSTLIVSPCVTAPLVGVLMYIGQTGDLLFGASALFALGIGMGIPLILIGMSAGKWLPKAGEWMDTVKTLFGIFMLAMAIWISSRVLSTSFTIILWGCLVLGIAIYLVKLPGLMKLRRLGNTLSLVLGCSGMLIVFGGMGISNPVSNWLFPVGVSTKMNQAFTVVHDVADFNKQLLVAQASHKSIILDFYADWCESGVSMDKHVFNTPNVKEKLNNYLVLRADLSANNAQDQALLKYFDVIAPPTVIFFDAKGQEVASRRIVGEVDAKEFLGRLESL